MSIAKNYETNVATAETTQSIQQYISAVVRDMENKAILTDKGKIYSEATIRGYKSLLAHFTRWQVESAKVFKFEDLNYNFAVQFQRHLTAQGLAKNSISLVMSKFKAVLKFAWRDGLSYWNGSGFKTPTEQTTQVYLTFEEIKKLRNATLTNSETVILDTFIIQIFTGLRFGTLCKFLENPLAYIQEHDGKSYIDIISDKTGEQSLIPIGEAVRSILAKYGGTIKTFTEQHVNATLKTIARKAGISHGVVSRRTEGGITKETLVDKSKMISTHTARRTLISLMRSNEFPDHQIMLVSGHSSQAQMAKYDRSGSFQKVKHLLGNSFFDTSI